MERDECRDVLEEFYSLIERKALADGATQEDKAFLIATRDALKNGSITETCGIPGRYTDVDSSGGQ